MKATYMLIWAACFTWVNGTSFAVQNNIYATGCSDNTVTSYNDMPFKVESFSESTLINEQLATTENEIIVTLSLKSVSDVLTFNKVTTPDNALEYSWEVKIDTNSDQVYDLSIALKHFKFPEASPEEGTILSHTQANTWIYNGDYSWSFGHPVEVYIDYDTKSIVMTALKSWDEFNQFDSQDTFTINSYYMVSGYENSSADTTGVETVGNVLNDQESDVSYSFIDIVGGNVAGASNEQRNSITPIIQMLLL
ncbi:MAG: hypothetical protein SD837_19560 [Candidatus Electrothrix scaldis]|nr:MAG: hypothetical protein SD837_19560 [Candidatus Electrothrix sp. GW3-3]